MDRRDEVSEEQARVMLGLPEDAELPDEEELTRMAKAIVQSNIAFDRELSPAGILISPLWEERDGASVVRAVALPPDFRSRYFTGMGLETPELPNAIRNVVDLVPWMYDDPVGAAIALSDVHELWHEPDAPFRKIADGHVPLRRLVSLLLADIARKGAAGFTALEHMVSLGIPIDDVRTDDDPTIPEVKASMKSRTQSMWDEEKSWVERFLR